MRAQRGAEEEEKCQEVQRGIGLATAQEFVVTVETMWKVER